MENAYAQALWKAVESGKDPKSAVSTVVKMLEAQGRSDLLPRIVRALKRLEAKEKNSRTKLYVAREQDAAHARHESGAKDAEVLVDKTLIGGWRLEGKGTLVDNSFKNRLLDIYNKATA